MNYKILNSLIDSIVSFKELFSKFNVDLNFSLTKNSLMISLIKNNKKLDHQLSMIPQIDQELNYYCNSILFKLQKGEF